MSPSRVVAIAASLALAAAALSGCAVGAGGGDELVRVPDDVPSLSEAADRVAENGMILVSPGVYEEQVTIDTPGVTLRGTDRNGTIIDGGGRRAFGVVVIADGVTVQNLTVRRTTFYGVLVTGLHDENGPSAHGVEGYESLDPEQFPPVQRFLIDHVTVHNNGLYGIYAFDAQHGVIADSYASGSADSGFYVGQCEECDILVIGNVAERNAVGFENANASDSVFLIGNRFSGNRVGLTLTSNYQEAFTPQRANTVIGNLVSGNDVADSPEQADGGFGIGIGIAGGRDNVLERNRVTGNPRSGILLSNTEDLAAVNNLLRDSAFEGNGVDLANISVARSPAEGNCVEPGPLTVLPSDLLASCPAGGRQPAVGSEVLPLASAPPGMSFLEVTEPPDQPDMPDPEAAPRPLPDRVPVPDLASIPLPGADLLADRAGTALGGN